MEGEDAGEDAEDDPEMKRLKKVKWQLLMQQAATKAKLEKTIKDSLPLSSTC